jgi:protein-S-isoprenylcysteine O-methyltransferase Ste14
VTIKNDEMTKFGVGPKIAKISLPFLALTIVSSMFLRQVFKFPLVPPGILFVEGILLIVIGVFVNISSANKMMKALKEGRLLTDGFYGICRNPMYASFVFLMIPGLAMALNNWLVLASSLVVCLTVRKFVPEEESMLLKKFGDEYRLYQSKVSRIIPFVRFKGSSTQSE